jgi:hypothetical protein
MQAGKGGGMLPGLDAWARDRCIEAAPQLEDLSDDDDSCDADVMDGAGNERTAILLLLGSQRCEACHVLSKTCWFIVFHKEVRFDASAAAMMQC